MEVKEVLDILPYIIKCYETEVHLYNQFGQGNVADPVNMAKLEANNLISETSKFFIVEENNNFIGYYSTYEINTWNALSSFFIMPEFRDKKLEFFNLLAKPMNHKFIISIKDKNIRAIKFMEKIGAKEYYTQNNTVFFKFGEF